MGFVIDGDHGVSLVVCALLFLVRWCAWWSCCCSCCLCVVVVGVVVVVFVCALVWALALLLLPLFVGCRC